jgi:hypothetical protein
MGKAIERTRRCVVFNSVGSFQSYAAPRKNKLSGFQFVSNLPQFVKAMRAGIQRGSFRICYTPVEGDETEEFAGVSKLVWFAENCVFAIDEVWLYQRPTKSPFHLRKMMLTGRHHGITLLWTAQRPALTDATLRSVSDQLYSAASVRVSTWKRFGERWPMKRWKRFPLCNSGRSFTATNCGNGGCTNRDDFKLANVRRG